MLHDRTGEFIQNYSTLGIKNVKIAVKAPNMNAIAERVIGSIRRECLDNFIILHRKQLYNILTEYIQFYNSIRPHQGIGQASPKGYEVQSEGLIQRRPVLGGLMYDYFRAQEVAM